MELTVADLDNPVAILQWIEDVAVDRYGIIDASNESLTREIAQVAMQFNERRRMEPRASAPKAVVVSALTLFPAQVLA